MVDVVRVPVRLCNRSRVVAAALGLEQQGQLIFTPETLTVACWRRWPQHFGLEGYEVQHPDSHKVLPMLVGNQGLVKAGHLAKRRERCFALTPQGRQLAYELVEQYQLPFQLPGARFAQFRCALPPGMETFLGNCLDGEAVALRTQGRESEISFPEAATLFGLRARSQGEEVAAALNEFRQQLIACVQAFADQKTVVLTNGREVTRRDVDGLAALAGRLEVRYRRHLELMESRK